MITVEAGPERTNINDKETGKPIFITTTVRKAFRNAFPLAKKVRNNVLNIAIATIFSESKTTQRFRPKKSLDGGHDLASGGNGIIRNVGGGRFIAILEGSWLKLLDFKGAPPTLNLPAAPTSSSDSSGLVPSGNSLTPYPDLTTALTGK